MTAIPVLGSVAAVRQWAYDRGVLPVPAAAPAPGSREVSFALAHEFVSPFLAHAPGSLPLAFTPGWRDELDEQIRFVSVLQAAAMWALRTECEQRAAAEAQRDAGAVFAEIRYRRGPDRSARFLAAEGAQPPFIYPPSMQETNHS